MIAARPEQRSKSTTTNGEMEKMRTQMDPHTNPNVVSFSRNVVLRGLSFSLNVVWK